MKLRTISDLNIEEVSLIDNKMRPCYESTTVETRAEGEDVVHEYRADDFETEYDGFEDKKPAFDDAELRALQDKIKEYENGGTI